MDPIRSLNNERSDLDAIDERMFISEGAESMSTNLMTLTS
ncbi:MAG: hypothetical protein K0S31_544 [Sphingobacterium multivorum]|jgi:hypothetical protein|nr:hypothetical protein [Sphingobacterium multivorum]